MTMMFKTFATLSLGVAGLALAGCDSQAENEVELQAEAIDEAAEGQANVVEAFGQGGPDEEAANDAAVNIAEEGEQTKDRLEDMADEMDEAPQ
jgi:predicted secreted protein